MQTYIFGDLLVERQTDRQTDTDRHRSPFSSIFQVLSKEVTATLWFVVVAAVVVVVVVVVWYGCYSFF